MGFLTVFAEKILLHTIKFKMIESMAVAAVMPRVLPVCVVVIVIYLLHN